MSVFMIKVFALLAMCLDHAGVVLGVGGWGIISAGTYKILRGIGRLPFPIYSCLLVNGWNKSKNLNKYLTRLVFFAIISQIPYTMALNQVNLMPQRQEELIYLFKDENYYIIELLLVLASWFFYCNAHIKKNILLIILALLLAGFKLKVNRFWLLSAGELNVFYTLAMGLLTIMCLDRLLKGKKEEWYKKFFLFLAILLGNIYIASRSDYGFAGIVLICVLYIVRKRNTGQAIVICLWSIIFYGFIIGNMYNAMFSCLSALVVLMYNGKKGISIKYFFYLAYPVHLFLLGCFNYVNRLVMF